MPCSWEFSCFQGATRNPRPSGAWNGAPAGPGCSLSVQKGDGIQVILAISRSFWPHGVPMPRHVGAFQLLETGQ